MADAAASGKNEGGIKGFFRAIGNFFHGIWVFIRGVLALVGLSTVLLIACIVVLVSRIDGYEHKEKSLPSNIVLTYTFSNDITEAEAGPSLTQPFIKEGVMLRDLIAALDDAGKDARVKGLVAKLDGLSLSVAQVQELRDTIAKFRKAGKFAYIYGDSYGDMSPGMKDYYFATSFQQLWLQPVGFVGLTGISMETPFVRGFFDKVGVEPQFGHKGIYKSAPESLTNETMTEPTREALTSMIGDLMAQIRDGIAADRKMTQDEVKARIDSGPYTDKAALEAKLIDKIGYYDEMLEMARKEAGLSAKDDTVELGDYADDVESNKDKSLISKLQSEVKKEIEKKQAAGTGTGKKQKIALIRGVGEISAGNGKGQGKGFDATEVAEAFDDARENKDIVAIVFRVDSPGGSPTASETVRRAMAMAQKAGKPVVVSMSGYAASGGYWVSTSADKIVAEPATITGSIGVFGGKFVLAGLWEKLGINWVSISEGQNAEMWTMNRKFTDAEFAKFDAALGSIYDGFIERVSQGRKMTKEQAEAIAQGRVWTGRQAKERGLVDELGGLDRAMAMVKEIAKLDAAKDYDVVEFPEPKSPFEKIMDLAEGGAYFKPELRINPKDLAETLRQTLESEVLRAPYDIK